jgi:hypothetical protein
MCTKRKVCTEFQDWNSHVATEHGKFANADSALCRTPVSNNEPRLMMVCAWLWQLSYGTTICKRDSALHAALHEGHRQNIHFGVDILSSIYIGSHSEYLELTMKIDLPGDLAHDIRNIPHVHWMRRWRCTLHKVFYDLVACRHRRSIVMMFSLEATSSSRTIVLLFLHGARWTPHSNISTCRVIHGGIVFWRNIESK